MASPDPTAPTSVLNASALMALMHGEDGRAVVAVALAGRCAISVVNWAEVLFKIARLGVPALTTDRIWAETDLGVDVQLIC